MKVTLTKDGATVDAHDLGPLLGRSPADVPAKMRAGEITSQSEHVQVKMLGGSGSLFGTVGNASV